MLRWDSHAVAKEYVAKMRRKSGAEYRKAIFFVLFEFRYQKRAYYLPKQQYFHNKRQSVMHGTQNESPFVLFYPVLL